ncbi:MAG TPA: c-type cytochrome [Candidatus Binatus sp.]|jgi:mono/diheme cytochrome c family protein|nr:c-type cytochrome [Candidatus Binatus sp.]
MGKALCVLSMLLLAVVSASAQESKPAAASAAEYKIPPEAAKMANPVKPTAASIAQGKKMYEIDCEMCHGKDGDGKGDLAADMKAKLADYHDPAALKDRTDGELFYIIKNGKGEMPSEGDRAKPDAMWNLVNYIRSLAKKEPSIK